MPLDPQFRTVLDTFESKGLIPLVRGDAAETRAHYRMLALSRHFDFFLKQQQQGQWVSGESAPQLADLDGRTVLVVGLGGIGTEVARRAHALGMRVTATRASGRDGPDFVSYIGLPDELPKLAREADFIVNCAPLTAQTTGIFNRVRRCDRTRTGQRR